MNTYATVYHDQRKKSPKNIYTVKIRVYHDGAEKMYPVIHKGQKLRLSPADFDSSYKTDRPKNEHRDYKISITECLNRSVKIIESMDVFSYIDFEKYYTGKIKGISDVIGMYERIIQEKEKTEDIGTAISYKQSLSSILAYIKYKKGIEPKTIPFREITKDWLNEYEYYMRNTEISDGARLIKKKCTSTTVGIYLRPLRSVFNAAIKDEKIISPELYPFGKGRNLYSIPTGKKAKKALSKEQIQEFYRYDLTGNEHAFKARAFWFFSYMGNGMNMKDIALLQYKDFREDTFSFIRAKTEKSTRENPITVIVPITEYVRGMIEIYGNSNKAPENYVFDIINDNMNAYQKNRAVKNFTRFVNQHTKPVAALLKFPSDFSTYYARHSFATIAMQNGARVEILRDMLGHINIKTTVGYMGGFPQDQLKGIYDGLLN